VATGAVARAASAPPAGAGNLVLEAQRAFAAQRYAEAEEKYQALLRLDENNTFTLGNLALIQLEQGRLDAAEQTLQKALALAPGDARLLGTLGYLRFRQQRYDEALDALSRSASLDPNNAQVQNHLGVVLNHKGLRGPAETALRRALQLDPKFSAAHNNLAVIYAAQQPPALELARWHYQRALANGHPRNPELEKLLEHKPAPGASAGR
jgi:Flp pilus assembly protein TadD